jgi:opacity protein-like surface antigen
VGFNGWEASAEGKLLPWIGVVLDVGRYYGSHEFTFVCNIAGNPQCPTSPVRVNGTLSTYLIGPRLSVPVGKFTPFAHILFGAGRISDSGAASNSSTSFATAIGGGLDYKLIKGVAWRLQGDELRTDLFSKTQNHLRFSTGIDIRF